MLAFLAAAEFTHLSASIQHDVEALPLSHFYLIERQL